MAKTLILYYSRDGENHYDGGLRNLAEGNTHVAVGFLAKESDADLFRVDTVVPYAAGYKDCCAQAVAEWKGNARPEVKEMPGSVEAYDTVVVAFPIWCGTMPMCLYTVLERLDLSGKRVFAFATHEGSGFARSVEALAQLCPGALVEPALAIKGCQVAESEDQIRAWAKDHL